MSTLSWHQPRLAGEVPFTFNDSIWVKLNAVMCGNTAAVHRSGIRPAGLKVYPNPSASYTTIELLQQNYNVTVYDSKGEMFWQKLNCSESTTLETGSWKTGVYYVQIATGNSQVWSEKLVISR